MKEIWKDVPDYETYYQASNLGRIRSLDREVTFKNGDKRKYIGKIIKYRYHNGYQMVNLHKKGKMKEFYVHHIIARTFLGERPEGLVINHKDGIKSNNKSNNLEYVTSKENNEHANNLGLRNNNIEGLKTYTDTLKKKIVAIKNNKIIAIEDCSRDMAEKLLAQKLITDVTIETAARAIRKSATRNLPYKNIYFQYFD